MGFVTWILSWFGGGPLGKIIDGLTKAHADALNAKTEEEKVVAKDRIDRLNSLLADTQNARVAASNMPWWMAVLAFLIGAPFAVHVLLIGIGTWWVAPGDWDPERHAFIIGNGWLEWTRHIPPFPKPFDTQEANVIGFFFGFGAVAVAGGAVVNAVTALAKRKS